MFCAAFTSALALNPQATEQNRVWLSRDSAARCAGRTGLRRVRGSHSDDAAPVLAPVPLQRRSELAPGLIQDGSVEARLLTHVRARVLAGAARRRRHGPDAQVLDDDQAVSGAELVGGLVGEVRAAVS